MAGLQSPTTYRVLMEDFESIEIKAWSYESTLFGIRFNASNGKALHWFRRKHVVSVLTVKAIKEELNNGQ
jgi:hypothetical protein